MPNHIKNKIELIGSESEISEFVKAYSTFYPQVQHTSYDGYFTFKKDEEIGWLDTGTNLFKQRNKEDVLGIPEGFSPYMESEWTRFPDFDKVFPVPECIKAVGNMVNSSIIIAVEDFYSKPLSENRLLAALESCSRKKVTVKPEEEEQFLLACKAYEETGFAYWYDFNIAKWGTKWNSYSCEKINDSTFTFETAWCGVLDIIKEVSKNFNGSIIYKYADEDTGCNTGSFKIVSGLILEENIPQNASIEGYDLAFELRPDDKENYTLINGKYEYIE